MRTRLGVLIVGAALTAACSGKNASSVLPTAPTTAPSSPAGPTTAQTGASISGLLQNATPAATVAIAGSASATAADAAGRFTLTNVPTGDVQLQISAAGGSASVAIAGVQPAQAVEVTITLAGASATLESEVRNGAGDAELKGLVEAMPPATAAATFRAAGKTVRTDAVTVFHRGSAAATFADVKAGLRIEARGSLAGDTFNATDVQIEDRAGAPAPAPLPTPTPTPTPAPVPSPGPGPEVETTGTIDGLSGSAASFQFSIGSRVFRGDVSAQIVGSSNTAKSFADLKNGQTVEVKGVQKDGFVQLTVIHIEGPETEPNDGVEIEIEGTLGSLTGSCPAISSSVSGTPFATSGATLFDGTACTAFKAGDRVQVKGPKSADGSIAATRVRKR